MPIFSCSIPGRCYIKKNTARHFGRRTVYSPNYLAWEKTALLCLKQAMLRYQVNYPLNFEIEMSVVFHFANRQAECDLSNLIEGPQDVLQKAGVIKDDRLIYSLDGSRKVFGEEARTEITILEFTRT